MTTRPKLTDEAIVREAAAALAPKVQRWLDEERDLSEIEEDISEAIQLYDDGYDVAKWLGSKYDPDAELVEILNEAGHLKRKALHKAEAAWVAANKIPEIPIGTRVRWARKAELGVGVVTRNHPDGKSTVTYPIQAPGHGYVVEWEALEIVEGEK